MAALRVRSVAVVGDGPAGTTVAALLARAGLHVGLFSRGRPRTLVVGESLVPAVVPLLRELGVEEEIADYSVRKPGATFVVGPQDAFQLRFADFPGRVPSYAYNVPRDRFDRTLLDACRKSGAEVIEASAQLEAVTTGEPGRRGQRLRLTRASLEAAGGFFAQAPDFVVDASGRARLAARLLRLPTRSGGRRDTALFAHWEGVPIDNPGQVHTDRLGHGWAWRIPLPGRVSLGVVVDPGILRQLGEDSEQQYHAFLGSEPYLERLTAGGRRLTPVVKYDNYQLTTLRGVGAGWALAGDAFGFIDPVFSSGLFLAMHGGRALADAILAGSDAALRRYESAHRRHLEAWRKAVGYFYDGRFFALFRLAQQQHDNWIGRVLHPHLSKHLPKVFTGESTMRRYDRWLLDQMIERVLEEPEGGYATVG